MKRYTAIGSLAVVMALGLTASPASAQSKQNNSRRHGDPAERIERRLERLDQELDLADAQEQQIKNIFEEHQRERRKHIESARAEGQQNRDAHREYLRAQSEETDRAIAAVLTPEQQEKYTQLKSERRDRPGRRGAMRGGDRSERMMERGQRFFEELGLTDEQQEQVRQIFSEQSQEMRTWMTENKDASRDEKQAHMAEQMKEADARLESVLNPEQLEKYSAQRDKIMQRMQEHRKRRGERRERGERKEQHQHDPGAQQEQNNGR